MLGDNQSLTSMEPKAPDDATLKSYDASSLTLQVMVFIAQASNNYQKPKQPQDTMMMTM